MAALYGERFVEALSVAPASPFLRTDGAGVLRTRRLPGRGWHEQENVLVFVGLGHLGTSEVGAVLARTIRRIERHLRRREVLPGNEDGDLHADPETGLAAAVASGQVPPAGPQWAIRLRPPERSALACDEPLCASLDGFTLHAATRAGALDASSREALLRYVLRPPFAQDWIEQGQDGLVDPLHFQTISRFLESGRRGRLAFVAAGTSSSVWPASALVDEARRAGAETWLVNAEAADNTSSFHHFVQGRSGEVLPGLLG